MEPPAISRVGGCGDTGILDGPSEMILEIPEGIVQQIAVQPLRRTLNRQRRMWIAPGPGRGPAAHEAQPPFGIPGMPDPAAEVPGPTVQPAAGQLRYGMVKPLANRLRQLEAQSLIGVEAKNPGLGTAIERDLFLDSEARPWRMLEPCAKPCRDFRSTIGGSRVHDDDLGGEVANALEATGQVHLFVEGDDGDGERQRIAHRRLECSAGAGLASPNTVVSGRSPTCAGSLRAVDRGGVCSALLLSRRLRSQSW